MEMAEQSETLSPDPTVATASSIKCISLPEAAHFPAPSIKHTHLPDNPYRPAPMSKAPAVTLPTIRHAGPPASTRSVPRLATLGAAAALLPPPPSPAAPSPMPITPAALPNRPSPPPSISVTSAVGGKRVKAAGGGTDRMEAWERGEPDYMGQDRFENIMARLNLSIGQPAPITPVEEHKRPQEIGTEHRVRYEPKPHDEEVRRQRWEAGNIDYCGEDSFDRIRARLDANMKMDREAQ